MLLIISVVLILVLAAFLFLASRKPDEFRVTRSALIDAAPEAVFPHIADVKKNHAWSPWVAMEPEANYSFEGPASGVGACVRWEGKKTGKGSATTIESRPNELIKTRLEFLKPMVATNTAELSLSPEQGRTRVTWTMYGPNNFSSKCFSMFVNCEKMVGAQFEQGLANLRNMVERGDPRSA